MESLLQAAPESHDGAFWYVFEHLAHAELSDASALDRMTPGQRVVFALGMLRQEVNSGGFEAYFRYTGGNTALLAGEAAHVIDQSWQLVVRSACSRLGDPYPVDQAAREAAVDALIDRDPETFDQVDSAFYDLEADHPADEKLDAYVWNDRAAFFS